MIHIVFNEPDVKLMEQVIALDESLTGDIIQVKDDFAVGPLDDLNEEHGRISRKEWWQSVLEGSNSEAEGDQHNIDDHAVAISLCEKLEADPEEKIWIWAAQNNHDVCGYYWLLDYLKPYCGCVFILYLNNLPFINDKGNIFYPERLEQIPAKEFLKAKKLAREITLSEFETDPDEWQKIVAEHKGVRILEGGKKLKQFDYDHYDAEIKKYVTTDFQKVSRVLREYYSKSKLTTGDAYILWRLKIMAAQEIFDVQGELKGIKDFELRLKPAHRAEETGA